MSANERFYCTYKTVPTYGRLLSHLLVIIENVEKLHKITKYTTFGYFENFYIKKTIVLNTFSGTKKLWRLLGEYEWTCMLVYGAFEWVRGAKYC